MSRLRGTYSRGRVPPLLNFIFILSYVTSTGTVNAYRLDRAGRCGGRIKEAMDGTMDASEGMRLLEGRHTRVGRFLLLFDVDGETDTQLVNEWIVFVQTKLMRHWDWPTEFDEWRMWGPNWGEVRMSDPFQSSEATDVKLVRFMERNGFLAEKGRYYSLGFRPKDVRVVPEEVRWED